MTAPDPDSIPPAVMVRAIIAYTSRPAVWRLMNPRRWAQLGWLVTITTADQPAIMDEIRYRHPGWTDQANAAERETRARAQHPIPGTTTEWLDPDFAAMCALRGQALRIIAGVSGGTMTRCPHADITRPRPLYASAWGTRLQCLPCLTADPHPEDPPRNERRMCDLCGHRQRREVTLATPTVGILTIGMGICDACIRRMAVVANMPPADQDG